MNLNRPKIGFSFIIILLVLIYLVPVIYILLYSFFDDIITNPFFMGFDNYLKVLIDGDFWSSILATMIFTIFSTVVQVSLALYLALFTFQKFKTVNIFRWIFIIPYFLPTIVIVVAWDFFIDPTYGILPEFIKFLGYKLPNLRDPNYSLIGMMVVSTYEAFPFCYAFILAGLLQIPPIYFNMAELDHTPIHRVLTKIILPKIKGLVIGLIIIRFLINILKFDVPWLVYAYKGFSKSSETLSIWLYRRSFMESVNTNIAFAGIIIFFLLIVIIMIIFKILKRGNSALSYDIKK